MGLEKLVIRFAQKSSAWIKYAGRNSVLQTKVSKPVITIGKAEPTIILPDGSKLQKEAFSILRKNGQTAQFMLEKKTTPLSSNSLALRYNISDSKGQNCGYWEGLIDLGHDSYIRGFNLESKASGVGSAIKNFIKKEAIANGCKKIYINAALESHMFHNKMGYKSAFAQEELNSAKEVLQYIKRKGVFPDFSEEIEQTLRSENIKEINSLIDRIFSKANTKGLCSEDIGIAQVKIPMEYTL